ncbi:hypothetical protein AAF712_013632 [Marasmius tenuissimus]|uniref:F-box domain-containing protein n=1 Tax=Marasmius tenuissimus TaxID=585030 RepID=A0ABR2ZE45_9AGAR
MSSPPCQELPSLFLKDSPNTPMPSCKGYSYTKPVSEVVVSDLKELGGPIARIPNELLLKIFAQYVKDGERVQDLLRVCTSGNDLDGPLSEDAKGRVPMGLLTQLKRSKDLPLDIRFSDLPNVPPPYSSSTEHAIEGISRLMSSSAILFNLLLSQRYRWKSARLSFHANGGAIFLLQTYQTIKFPTLETLSLGVIANKTTEETFYAMIELTTYVLLLQFQDTPRLVALDMPVLPYKEYEFPVKLAEASYSNLVDLKIEFCSGIALVAWLERTKMSLATCVVQTVHSFFDTLLASAQRLT